MKTEYERISKHYQLQNGKKVWPYMSRLTGRIVWKAKASD